MSLLMDRYQPKRHPGPPQIEAQQSNDDEPNDPFLELKFKIHERLIREIDPARLAGKDQKTLRGEVEEATRVLLAAEEVPLARHERGRLVTEVADEVLGLGPLEPLIQDATISEVMVNGPQQVYFERGGILYRSDRVFRDEDHILRVIEKIVSPLGRRIDDNSPMVDARLPDGSRVNCVIPPLALDSPVITIRKFAKVPLTVENLIEYGTFTAETAKFMAACVEARLNIIISGGTGSGKTTLLNVLSSFLPGSERIVTIEDPAELQLRQRHVVRLETRPPNIEGRGEIVQRDLVRNALRMRPDRIIVGEVRSGEAFDMLQAMNTGHDGSLTTVHANSPRDALARIENMVLMAGFELPVRAIREQIASAIHLMVHMSRVRDGSRKVTHVTEVVGMEGQTITLQDLFVYQQAGIDKDGKVVGLMRATGIRPKFTDRLEQTGIFLPADIFFPEREVRR